MILKLFILWVFGSSLVLCNVIPRIDTVCYKCTNENSEDCVKVQIWENYQRDSCEDDECVVFIDGKDFKLIFTNPYGLLYYVKQINWKC